MTMYDRIDRRRPITSRGIVPEEREFHTAATKQPPRFKRCRKRKSTTGNPDPAGRTIRAGTSKLGLRTVNNFKHVIGVIGNDSEGIPWLNRTKVKFGSPAVPRYEGFPVCDHGCRFDVYFTSEAQRTLREPSARRFCF